MARLKVYTVHINPSFAHPYETAEFVKEGFCWPAFFATGLWAAYNRMWGVMVLFAAWHLTLFSLVTSKTFSHTGLLIIFIGTQLLIGFEANEWLRGKLRRKGFVTADITTGDSKIRAELRFFDRYFTSRAPLAG